MKNIGRFFIYIFAIFFAAQFLPAQTTHIVQKGDTLYSLSKKYGLSADEIRAANNMGASSDLFAGTELQIPDRGAKTPAASAEKPNINYIDYTVQSGDTLYSISRQNTLSVDELRSINGLDPSSVLKIGQKLKVPAAKLNKPEQPPLVPAVENPRLETARLGDASLIWPVKAQEVLYVSGKISGVALVGLKNEHVTAIRSGTCMFSGMYRGFGQVVFIQAASGHIYVYTGLASILVKKGDYVNYGQQLGSIGKDSLSGKNLINLMVFQKGNPIDPAKAPRG